MAKLSTLESTLAPVVDTLKSVADQLAKAKDEIIAALGDVEIPAGAQAKLDALGSFATQLKSASQALDDLNPDAAVTPPANP